MGTVYQFDTFSQTIAMSNAGAWITNSKGYYYAIIPLEVGKVYKVTLQNVTTLASFRVAQADSTEIGTATLSFVGYTETPTNDLGMIFTARKKFLICYGGESNGGAVVIEESKSLQTQTLAGTTWNFNDIISFLYLPVPFSVNFKVLSGDDQTKDFIALRPDGYLYYQYSSAALQACSPSSKWFSEDYKTIKIIDGADVTNEIFIEWMLSNATLVDAPATATVITYNGSTIATLEAGQTATIKTAETEVEHDIVITPVFPIEIAYGDIIATAEAGQTATVKTANTEADFDIVVSAKAEEANYLTFSSPSSFTLRTNNYSKNWDGTLEYSTDANAWNTWSGGSTITADGGKLYLRGTGNTKITEGSNKSRWVLSGSNIACEGNIETLLDYATVANGGHPAMGESCFAYLFYQCYAIISTPSLPATTLTYCCYTQMFRETSIESAPVLPATTLAGYCYANMFYGCTKLVNAPALPATTLAGMCYQNMFFGCTKLTSIPALPAPLLTTWCYYSMFEGCSSVKFSNTQTEEYKYEYKIPSSGTGSGSGTQRMFISTGGTFTDDPSINTTYYTSNTVVY